MPKLIANALLFQLGWLVCVFAGDSPWLLVVAVIIGVHLLWVSSWAAEGKLLLSVFLAGSALDSFLLNLGVFDFGEERQLIPCGWPCSGCYWPARSITVWPGLPSPGGEPACSARLPHRCPTTAAPRSPASPCHWVPGQPWPFWRWSGPW